MMLGDPAIGTPAALEKVQAALAAALAAPLAGAGVAEGGPLAGAGAAEEEESGDIATPRAKAAAALEAALRARREWHWERGERDGEALCKVLMDMCAWHEHARLRDQILDLQKRGLALLLAVPDGQPGGGQVDDLEQTYLKIKPREDDAEAIAAALGMSVEEARAFGLVGTLGSIGFDDEEPPRASAEEMPELEPEPEEDLETIFRREAAKIATKMLPQALQRFWSAQQSMDALINVRRGFHTLKGDARVTAQSTSPEVADELEDLAVLSEAAEDIIDYLLGDDYDIRQQAPALPAGAFSVLNETAAAIGRRLESRGPLPEEVALLRRLEGMQRKAAAVSGTPIDEASLVAKIPTPRAPLTPRKPAAPPKAQPHSLLPTFLEEADRLMPDLHRALAALSTNPGDEAALVRARVKLHTLKGGAALVGQEAAEVQAVAHSAEDLFELIEDFQLRGQLSVVPREVLDGVLDAEDALQALIDSLRRLGRSGRLVPLTPALPVPPADLARRLDEIAERVRRGDIVGPAALPAPIPEVPARPASATEASDAPAPIPAATEAPGAPPPATVPPLPGQLLQRVVVPPAPRPTGAVPGKGRSSLRTVSFRDLIERGGHVETRGRAAVVDRARLLEDKARQATKPFSLFVALQQLQSYEEQMARYRDLAGRQGQVYVFARVGSLPPAEERVTLLPLDAGDALLAERIVIFDAQEGAAAFLAHDEAAGGLDAGRRFLSAHLEDPQLVRSAAERLRAAMRQDAALIALRRAGLHGSADRKLVPLPRLQTAAPVRRKALAVQQPPHREPEYGKEQSVRTALSALEDLSVSRDALQELIDRMLRQAVESRRSTRRLRTLVERVGSELAGLRSELVRTTRHTGEWDLLEKEEYTTIDVLLMQLDEALADLEESDTNLRHDLGEARAQVETQSDSQLRAQRSLLDMSMIPLSQIEDRLNHAVRSQSRRLNKQAAFAMEGGDLLLDGRIAETLFEPLLHLINNALDHGLEDKPAERLAAGKALEGRLTIRGRSSGDGVVIEVADDGRGIDPERVAAVAVSRGIVDAREAAAMSPQERIALIWRPGFSTARAVTAISGRGMGMKSVLDEITSLQGRIEVSSTVGKGTTFTIHLPRSLAMLRVEVVREGRDLVAVPISQVTATYPIPYGGHLETPEGQRVEFEGRTLLVHRAHLANGPAGDGDAGQGMLLEVAGREGGILVDEVIGSQYLPVRAAPGYLRRHCGLIGYAVGGGGRILPILDIPTLVERMAGGQQAGGTEQKDKPAYSVLVVDDSQTMRRALRDTLTKAGFLVREAADGREALTTCTRAMPDLITLDMEMPGMDGLEALSALRLLPKGGATVPVFMITSRQQARHRAAALAAGVTRYFTKPYDTDELIGAAQLVLAEGVQHHSEAAS